MPEPNRDPTRTNGPGCGLIFIFIVLGLAGWLVIAALFFDWLFASLTFQQPQDVR
jgi:hypothetical protein